MTIQDIIDNAKIQAVIDQLQDMDDNEKLSIYNEYVLDNNDPEAEIFFNDEDFFQMCFDTKDLMELLNRAYYGDYNPNYTYVHFDRLGNLESSDWWEDLADWDEEEIAEYLIENEHYTIDWVEVEEQTERAINQAVTEAIEEITAGEADKFLDVWDDIVNTVKADDETDVVEVVEDYLNELWEE